MCFASLFCLKKVGESFLGPLLDFSSELAITKVVFMSGEKGI